MRNLFLNKIEIFINFGLKRNLIGLLCFIIGANTIQAQEIEKVRKNDILADPILLIAIPLANISYERLISQNKGIGVNAMIKLNNEDKDFKQFSPYFRYYMGKKYASGFFFEGFIPVTIQNDVNYIYEDYSDFGYQNISKKNKSFTTVGIGFGVGGKWVISNKLVIEASGGIARRFGDLYRYDIGRVIGKIMAGIGYRL
ncbi:DUF3575 domain-containing protein [Chryseobacterium formosus]|uniref:DUF3575 domain-containing protein n=1 Tax=Chryseobacterium formosus TaxID=1537363 RepID=A0ABT3XMS0_9FLAO|nr:DUF3575 domain-containing protein [Chryseobacterium formosus]MCX8522447.1 DUF3575 domain-containing protein [Chryseobacterium formosus]